MRIVWKPNTILTEDGSTIECDLSDVTNVDILKLGISESNNMTTIGWYLNDFIQTIYN